MMASFARRRLFNITSSITVASLLGGLRPVRVAQAAEGAPAWSVKGDHIYACPCEATCPCDFKSPPTAGYCTVLMGYHITSGRHGEVTLDGLNAVRMIHSPGHMSNGNFRVASYLDERADSAQREALSAIFSIKPGGAFTKMTKAVAQDLGARFVPITIEIGERRRKLSIGGIADADITAIPGQGDKEITVDNIPGDTAPLVAGRSARTTYKDYDLQLDVSGKTGGYQAFALSSA
jgi:hypothetical protein